MTDLAAKVLQLSPEQHEMLGHAIALAHAMHASIGGKGLGVAVGELHDALSHVDIFVQPGHGGKGWGPSNCCFPRARAAAQLCYAKQRADHRRHTRRSHWQRRPWWFLPAQSLQPCTENAANAQAQKVILCVASRPPRRTVHTWSGPRNGSRSAKNSPRWRSLLPLKW